MTQIDGHPDFKEGEVDKLIESLHTITANALSMGAAYQDGKINYRMQWHRLAIEADALHAMYIRDCRDA